MKRNTFTINELLALKKTLHERTNELKDLRKQLAVKERFFGNADKVVEPQYDVKAVDKKITTIQNTVFHIDAEVKRINAITNVSIELDVDNLLAPLE